MSAVYEFTDETFEQRHKLLQFLLSSKVCEVTFTKVDGTERVMGCTLSKVFIPAPGDELIEPMRKVTNPEVMPVFDMEKGEWRSFRVNFVTSVKSY